jgi:hypothetical protein
MQETEDMRPQKLHFEIPRVVVLGFVGIALAATVPVAAAEPTDSITLADGPILGVTKESNGAVMIELTPESFRQGRLEVGIKVTTHTVNDLDKYDLKKITTLEFTGQVIHPTSAPALKGHHTSGKLVFPLEALPKGFAIKIRGLDKPELRVLSWP